MTRKILTFGGVAVIALLSVGAVQTSVTCDEAEQW